MNIFQKLGELTSSHRDYQDVASALEKLRNSGKPVTVKFEGDVRSYSSRVTAFSREHRIFVLDNLFPSSTGETFAKGRVATISSTDNQKTITLSGICVEPLVKNQNMGYELRAIGSLTVQEFEQDFDFGLLQVKSAQAAPIRRAAGM